MEEIGDYITRRLNEDNIDIEEKANIKQNTSICKGYIDDYFNTMNTTKRTHSYHRLTYEIKWCDEEVINWLIELFHVDGHHYQRNIINHLKKEPLFLLYYSDDDFKKCTEHCYHELMKEHSAAFNGKFDLLYTFIKNYHTKETKKVKLNKQVIDPHITKFVHDVYETYNVNLTSFIKDYVFKFLENEDMWEESHKLYNMITGITSYDYKAKENIFNIDDLYEKVKDYPFLKNQKNMLKLLLLRDWLEDIETDEAYFHDYYQNVYLKEIN